MIAAVIIVVIMVRCDNYRLVNDNNDLTVIDGIDDVTAQRLHHGVGPVEGKRLIMVTEVKVAALFIVPLAAIDMVMIGPTGENIVTLAAQQRVVAGAA